MIFEAAGIATSTHVDRAAERPRSVPARGQLRVQRLALPGDQRAPDAEQRKRDLDELRQRADRPHRDRVPRLALAAGRGKVLGAFRPQPRRAPSSPTAGRRDGGPQERRLLADGLDEQDLTSGSAIASGMPGNPPPLPRSRSA